MDSDITEITKVDDQASGEGWQLINGDCVETLMGFPADSIGYSIYSLPFSSLFVYSNSDRDMGNSRNDDEFFGHYGFLVDQLIRVMKPGRLVSVHCMNLPSMKQNDGVIGIRDFRGDIIRCHTERGFIYHSEVTIWKDPMTAMQRTKALGLLHKQLVKDSSMSRQGIADYIVNFIKPTHDGEFTTASGPRDVTSILLELFASVMPSSLVTFRKPGTNGEPVHGRLEYFAGKQDQFQHRGDLSIDIWQQYASPIWMDINQSDTLQCRQARDDKDERHLCPLQLDVIERCLQLWTMPGDVVLSPFAGIGSEIYQAVILGRLGIGIELKPSYYRWAIEYMHQAEEVRKTRMLF